MNINRRNFLTKLTASAALVGLCPRLARASYFDYNIDIEDEGDAYNQLAFQNQLFGFTSGGLRQRMVWCGAYIDRARPVLLQAAVQFPAYFSVFQQQNSQSVTMVAQGKQSPRNLWQTQTPNGRGGYVPLAVRNVSEYINIPNAGVYFFLAHDVVTGSPPNECSLVMRQPILDQLSISEASKWQFLSGTPLLANASEGQHVAAGPFTILDTVNERYVLRGCVNNSIGWQTVDIVSKDQYLIWKAGKSYRPVATLANLFQRGVLSYAVGDYYLIFNKTASNPKQPLTDLGSMSYMFDRWHKIH